MPLTVAEGGVKLKETARISTLLEQQEGRNEKHPATERSEGPGRSPVHGASEWNERAAADD